MFTRNLKLYSASLFVLLVSLVACGTAQGWQDPDEAAMPGGGAARIAAPPAVVDQTRYWCNGCDVLYIDWGWMHALKADVQPGQWDGYFDYYGPVGDLCSPTWVPNASGPCPAMGMVVWGKNLFVANTNGNSAASWASPTTVWGDVMRFDRTTGRSQAKLVLPADQKGNVNPDAPAYPRGMVLWNGKLYVANMYSLDPKKPTADCSGDPTHACLPGSINVYDPSTGKLLNKWTPDKTFNINNFHPRGMVIGPDHLLYVAVRNLPNGDPNFNFQAGGWVMRFNPENGKYLKVLVDSQTCLCDLNRPEGIVFGPGYDHRLFVASFRTDPTDNDKVLVFAQNGNYLDKIPLADPESSGGKRAYAQGILFGPHDYLYVPITGSAPEVTGEVRRYDVSNYPATLADVMVPAYSKGGPLPGSQYLTFGKTHPGTLQYMP